MSRNITPDSTGKPAGLMFDQFAQAMRMGVDIHDANFPTPFPSPLLQVMPWPEFRYLTDFDLRSDLRVPAAGSVKALNSYGVESRDIGSARGRTGTWMFGRFSSGAV